MSAQGINLVAKPASPARRAALRLVGQAAHTQVARLPRYRTAIFAALIS